MIYIVVYVVGALVLSFLYGLCSIDMDDSICPIFIVFWPLFLVLGMIFLPFALMYWLGKYIEKKHLP